MKHFRVTLSRLSTAVDAKRLELEQLQKVNDSLRLRLAALQLSWRCQMEVLAHRRRPWREVPQAQEHDAPDELSNLEAHLQELQAHISGTVAEISQCSGASRAMHSPEGLPSAAAGASAAGGASAAAGAPPTVATSEKGDGGAGVPTQEASLPNPVTAEASAAIAGDVLSTLAAVAFSRGLPCRLHHLAVGRSVLHLSSATSSDVAQACGLTVESLRTIFLKFVSKARAAVDRVAAAHAEADSAQLLSAEADLERFGIRMQRCYNLMCIHSFWAYAGASMINWETGESAAGLGDAPMSHYEGVVRAGQLSRMQALLMIEMHAAYRQRLEPLHAERAVLSELLGKSKLQAVSAASTPPPQSVGSTSMDATLAGGGSERAAAAESSQGLCFGASLVQEEQAEEQLWALEANIKKEQCAWQAFAHTCIALFSPQQWVRLWVAAFPYPIHAAKCCQAMEHFLKFEPDVFVEPPN